MFAKSWKTTIIGLIGAVANALYPLATNGTLDTQTLINSAVLAALGWFAKDFNVSSGSKKR